ncbi:hypothetical protein GCM10011374_38780 [Kocuria dechangensis]|uniref:STAS domain-containing protein n=1 Tax=Kocuria dechangensis TaxID=1176249 RepID=A0A917H7C9_9MICC|nr:hypothetical protein [Kocuria dechangensis]GGG70473.1 hypothetical protein GCM10011374_38780 [Kocuria dechangensis]
MDHKLSVLVQIDLNGAYVRLAVTGCLTEANQHALHPLLRRARTLIPPVTVSIDLTCATHIEAVAVESLRWAIDHDEAMGGSSPVELLVPNGLRDHRPAPALSLQLPDHNMARLHLSA